MKRVFLFYKKFFIISAVFFSLALIWSVNATPVFYGYADTLTLYSDKYGSDGGIITVSGAGYIFVPSKTGESFTADIRAFDKDKFLKRFNAEKVFEEHFGKKSSYYFYSRDIKYCKTLYGKKVNIQICVDSDKVTVGTPVIYGGY